MALASLATNKLPNPPKSFFKLIGPSFILLGLGLGSGELIMWPYLVANWGIGIIWGALLGITIQYFLNMEIERYALANGESIFVGFARFAKYLPVWFVLSTVVAWSWPAFSSISASVWSYFGLQNTHYIAIGMLILVGLILTLGPTLYKTVETVEKVLILIAIPTIIFVAFMVIKFSHLSALFMGLFGVGENYLFLPININVNFPLMSFLAAFAYSGAGGNLMLAQSFYVKEKGYGMGAFAGKITSLITGKSKNVKITGTTFDGNDPSEVQKFKTWFKVASLEHLLVFWGMGLVTMLILATISYASIYGHSDNSQGINFLFNQANTINLNGGILGSILLVITSLMLFSTQLSVIDGAGRIIAENMALLNNKIRPNIFYYVAIWTVITFGALMLGFGIKEPQLLIVTGAVINAVCMFVFAGLLNIVNRRFLNKAARPSIFRQSLIWIIFVVLGIFTTLVFADKFVKF